MSAVDRLLTVDEVADILQVSPRTVRTWSWDRRIPSVKIGSRLRFKEADIDRWIDGQTREWK